MKTPLFICSANCCRSVLAYCLYRHLHPDDPALTAGLSPGRCISDRALGMLRHWGIDASGHCPRQVDRELCDRADAIFVMAPAHLHCLLRFYGEDLDRKTYLFADPFSQPRSFHPGEYKVYDPSFDPRPVEELVQAHLWMRERVQQIGQALRGRGMALVPASQYRPLIQTVDPHDV
ncbi:MAG: low molecular weight phosphatase family protein [Candidatus Dormibacteraeota bacterium]|nr:low molecular weight phosphatase family protein [Candidatus Dormibacteraeota bacterium]